jgi:hypothetical protein
MANSAVDAVELNYDENGNVQGLGFNSEQWTESAFGETAMFGYLGNVAGSLSEGFLNHLALSDANGNLLPQYAYQDAYKFTSWVGDAVDQGIQSIHTGEFTLNVLNLGDIINMVGQITESDVSRFSNARMGLLEFGLTSEGNKVRFGQGGLEVKGMSMVTAAYRFVDNPLAFLGDTASELGGALQLIGTVGKKFSEHGRTELNLVTAFDRMGTEEGKKIASILAKYGVSTYGDPNSPNREEHSYTSNLGFMVSKDFISESGDNFERLTSEVLMQSFAKGIFSGTKLDAYKAQLAYLDENLPEEAKENPEFYQGLLEKMQEIGSFEASLAAELLRKVDRATYLDRELFDEAMYEGKTVTELMHLFLSEKDQIDLYKDLSTNNEFNGQLLQDYEIDFAYNRNLLKPAHFNYNDVKDDKRFLMHKDDYKRFSEEGIIPLTSDFFPVDPQTEEERRMVEDYENNPEDYIHRLIPIGWDQLTQDSHSEDPRIENMELSNDYFNNTKNLFHADIYISQDPDEREALVAFRGTAQDNPMDLGLFGFAIQKVLSWTSLVEDPGPMIWQYMIAWDLEADDLKPEEWFSMNKFANGGGLAEQYKLGGELLRELQRNDFEVLVTGHSQGGGEALFHSAQYGYNSIVYNPQSVHEDNLLGSQFGDYQNFSQVYTNSFDPLNNSQDFFSGFFNLMPKVHGRRNTFGGSTGRSEGDYSIDGNFNHSFIPFYEWTETKFGVGTNYRRIQ